MTAHRSTPSKATPSLESKSQPAPDLPVVRVLYLFAGRRRHSDVQAEAAGKIKLVLKEFDIERSPMHDLTNVSLWDEILDTLKEGGWCVIVSLPCNTFSRARFQHLLHPGLKPLWTKSRPKGFPWLSNANKSIVAEANFFVEKCLEACECAASANGFFILEHPEGLGTVQGEQPGSIWQWHEVLDLIPRFSAVCFAIHQCQFGALTPKPTRLLTNLHVDDNRCYFSLPKFDKLGFYTGPPPKKCGHRHTHKLIGKTGTKWSTSPSAAYPAGMCEFLAHCILNAFASCGGGSENFSGPSRKRPLSESQGSSKKRRHTGALWAVTTIQVGSTSTSGCNDLEKSPSCNNTQAMAADVFCVSDGSDEEVGNLGSIVLHPGWTRFLRLLEACGGGVVKLLNQLGLTRILTCKLVAMQANQYRWNGTGFQEDLWMALAYAVPLVGAHYTEG